MSSLHCFKGNPYKLIENTKKKTEELNNIMEFHAVLQYNSIKHSVRLQEFNCALVTAC